MYRLSLIVVAIVVLAGLVGCSRTAQQEQQSTVPAGNAPRAVAEPQQRGEGSPENGAAATDMPHEAEDMPHDVEDMPHETEDMPHDVEDMPHGAEDMPHHGAGEAMPGAGSEHHEGHAPEGHHHGQDTATSQVSPSGTLKDGVRTVQVAARRYEFEPDTIVVKAGEKVKLLATSEDVAHGLEIEGLGINQQLPPHQQKVIEFTPKKTGRHHFHCSVYCGPGHDRMHGTLIVIE